MLIFIFTLCLTTLFLGHFINLIQEIRHWLIKVILISIFLSISSIPVFYYPKFGVFLVFWQASIVFMLCIYCYIPKILTPIFGKEIACKLFNNDKSYMYIKPFFKKIYNNTNASKLIISTLILFPYLNLINHSIILSFSFYFPYILALLALGFISVFLEYVKSKENS